MGITKNTSFKLDGSTKFKVGTDTYKWHDHIVDYISIWSPQNKALSATVTLTGSNWDVGTIQSGDNIKVIIQDSTKGKGGHIDNLGLYGAGGSDVTLGKTQVSAFNGGDGVDKITTGTGGVGTINVRGGDNVITAGGYVGAIIAFDGNDTVTSVAGDVGSINLQGGNNTVVGGSGHIDSIVAYDGDDVVNGGAGDIASINLGGGNNTVTIAEGWVGSIIASDGDDNVKVTGSNYVGSINLGKGDNVVETASKWTDTITLDDGDQTVTVGTGGVGAVTLGEGNHHFVANGYVWLLASDAGNGDYTFNADVGALKLGTGTNTLQFHGAYVDSMSMGQGNDTITMNDTEAGQITSGRGDDTLYAGSGGVGQAQLGRGNDIVHVVDLVDPNNGSSFSGGGSADPTTSIPYVDTVSFSDLAVGGVTISLSDTDYQETGAGSIRLQGFEKLVGTAFGDTLEGNNKANWLDGGAGADTLTGRGGIDTFIFSTGSGADTVADFVVADDLIDLSGLTTVDAFDDLAALMTQAGDDVKIDFGSGDTLLLKDVVLETLTSAQFTF